ncbi:hypothetical protein [Alicyclobacillus kakegawensis]|uniref:hypothetical protein n=1 Tax=Alicyclobacillus kakegawensis TaxID=392012 RepID=UPI0008352CE4|nr:hypothetical protein [Alicyclobacillus kakegawensis]
MAIHRAYFAADGQRDHGRSQPVVVRVGDKQWVIGDQVQPRQGPHGPPQKGEGPGWDAAARQSSAQVVDNPLPPPAKGEPRKGQAWFRWLESFLGQLADTGLANPARSGLARRNRRRARMADSFRGGLVFGLALGCLSLILFHQMRPNLPLPQDDSVQPAPIRATAVKMTGIPLQVPAVHLSVLEIGEYRSYDAAAAAKVKYGKRGDGAAVIGTSPYRLVVDAAVRSSSLRAREARLQQQGIPSSAHTLIVPACLVRTASTATTADVHALSTWLGAAVSAGNALVAVLSDGAPERDALAAYRVSVDCLPKSDVLAESGHADILTEAEKALRQAFNAMKQGNVQAAMSDLLNFYSRVIQLSAFKVKD